LYSEAVLAGRVVTIKPAALLRTSLFVAIAMTKRGRETAIIRMGRREKSGNRFFLDLMLILLWRGHGMFVKEPLDKKNKMHLA